MKVSYLQENDKLSEEQKAEVREAARYGVQFDEDSPEMTPEMEKAFEVAVKSRNRLKAI
jgi:hypothetical protein